MLASQKDGHVLFFKCSNEYDFPISSIAIATTLPCHECPGSWRISVIHSVLASPPPRNALLDMSPKPALPNKYKDLSNSSLSILLRPRARQPAYPYRYAIQSASHCARFIGFTALAIASMTVWFAGRLPEGL